MQSSTSRHQTSAGTGTDDFALNPYGGKVGIITSPTDTLSVNGQIGLFGNDGQLSLMMGRLKRQELRRHSDTD